MTTTTHPPVATTDQAPGPARASGPGRAVRDSLIIVRRNLLHLKTDPAQVIGMTLQPLMFLLLFTYVFGGAIAGSSVDYLNFALPGFLAQAGLFIAQQTAIGLNVDFQRGIVDRFRSLNMARSAPVSGRVLADLIRVVIGLIVITGTSLALGFRFGGSVGSVTLGMVLLLWFGFAMCWPMAFIGVSIRSAESVALFAFLAILPLAFASSVFAPVASMPGWLQAVVKVNPVTVQTDMARQLLMHGYDTNITLRAFVYSLAIVVVFAPMVVARYRRRS
ncbi:MAG TPA: ABC transporter permease [Micromonosporaceae bacterium]